MRLIQAQAMRVKNKTLQFLASQVVFAFNVHCLVIVTSQALKRRKNTGENYRLEISVEIQQ
jgi:hypothetical protein